MKMQKKLWAILFALLLCASLTACKDEEAVEVMGDRGASNQSWVVYWYLCGSDLESEYGAATEDLNELMEVSLPDNVKVVIETGGAAQWQNDTVDPERIQRYVYSADGLELVDEQPLANMGEADTLEDFLRFCSENYPADKTAVVFWNHGGGSVGGASFDENFEYDSLTLSELHQAFDAVYESDTAAPPLELVGFDTCLMATVDTAHTFTGTARYLVASEELEPGCGWYYSGWVQALADDPSMDGKTLGKAVCDSYMEGCALYDVEDEATLSVIDLSQLDPLLEAYEAMGAEALSYALENPLFFGQIGRQALDTENYGGNTRSEGYSNMLDLGHLAENCAEILPQTSEAVLDALEKCVVYQVSGDYRKNARGLSCYFSYNGDLDDLHGFKEEGYSDSFKYFFGYGIEGTFADEGMEYVHNLGYEGDTLPEVPEISDEDDQEYPLYIDEDGSAVLELDMDTVNLLKGVYFQLSYVDEENDLMLLLGQDNDIVADWDSGIFRDNFRGVWGSIDGNLVYMEVSYEAEDYTAYAVPILLNGEEYNLRVIYDYNEEAYHILGARKGLDDAGMADKNLLQLQPGDEITTVHYAATASGDDDFEPITIDTFTVTENTSFDEADLGDGTFVLMFELLDAKNNTAYSQMVQITAAGGEAEIEVLE